MTESNGMYQGYNVSGQAEIKLTPDNEMMGNKMCNKIPGVVCPPVYECPVEKCIHREIIHEVPQE